MKRTIQKISLRILLLTGFIVCVIPLFFCFIYLYINSYQTVEEMVISSTLSRNYNQAKEIDKQIYQLQKRQNECIVNDNMKFLVFDNINSYSDYEVSNAKLQILQAINIINTSNDISENVEIFFPENNLHISTENGISDISSEMESDLKNKIDSLNSNSYPYLENEIYIINSDIRIDPLSDKIPLITMLSTVSTQKIMEEINRQNELNIYNSKYVLQQGSTGEVLQSTYSLEGKNVSKFLTVDKKEQQGYVTEKINGESYIVTYTRLNSVDMILYELIPSKVIFSDINNIQIFFYFSVLFFVIMGMIFYLLNNRLYYKPTNILVDAFKELRENNFKVRIQENSFISEYDTLYKSFNETIVVLNDLIHKNAESKILIKEAQLKQLQFQINPHFLYNCFFILNSMIRMENYEDVEKMSNLLGTFLKYITKDKDGFVVLKEEDKYARVYSEIQLCRFSRRINIKLMELPKEIEGLVVPQLLIQPLIENCFIHGMKDVSENGIIKMSYEISENLICICVEDNGTNLSPEDIQKITNSIEGKNLDGESDSVALENIHKRLMTAFGVGSGLFAYKSQLGGLKIVAKLYLRKEDR